MNTGDCYRDLHLDSLPDKSRALTGTLKALWDIKRNTTEASLETEGRALVEEIKQFLLNDSTTPVICSVIALQHFPILEVFSKMSENEIFVACLEAICNDWFAAVEYFFLELKCPFSLRVSTLEDSDEKVKIAAITAVTDRKIMEFLLQIGANINEQNENGTSVLIKACFSGSLDYVKFLVEKGADVRVETDSQDTPLHCASMEGNLDVVKFLVGLGLDCNYNNSKGRSSVDLALLFEQYDVVQYYGELGADLSSLDLRTAIRSGNVKLVKLASRSDWDTIVYKDLLIEMCSSEEMVDVLLEGHNGDFFVGQGPYLVQCKQYWKKIWTILSKNTTFLDEVAKYPSIITNAWKHNPDAAFDILPYSVRGSENAYHFIKDIDVAKKYMQLCPEDSVNQLGHSTPLHSATKNRDLKHMKYLLEFGADITLKSLHDKNPVEQAVYDGFLEGVMLFFSFFGKEKILEVQKDSSIFVSYFDGLENNSIEMFDFLIQELIVTNENPFQNWKSLKNSRFCTNNAEFNIIRQIHEKYSTVHWFTGFFSKKFLRQMIKTPRLANSVIFFLRLKVFDVNDIVDGDQHTLVHTLLASKQNDAIEWIVSNTKACDNLAVMKNTRTVPKYYQDSFFFWVFWSRLRLLFMINTIPKEVLSLIMEHIWFMFYEDTDDSSDDEMLDFSSDLFM